MENDFLSGALTHRRDCERKAMIDRGITTFRVSRSKPRPSGLGAARCIYLPRPVPAADLELMRQIDGMHLEFPFTGAGCCAAVGCKGHDVGRDVDVTRLMRRMGIEALYRRPRTT